ncbi:MAG: FHA domain-containing protein [Planctomycetes bacterium]|nr:FHA domain-containing protein [Planctomycetota bacterium]
MRLTVRVDGAEHVVEGDLAVVGSAHDAQVVVPGLAPAHARVRAVDARVELIALAPEVLVRGEPVTVGGQRFLRRDDVVRLGEREVRVDVGLLTLGWRRALTRGAAFVGVLLGLVLFLFLSAGGTGTVQPARLALAALLALQVGAVVALATLVELAVARVGPTWRRRLAAGALTWLLVTLGFLAVAVNADHGDAVRGEGLAAAGRGAGQALLGCASLAIAHRLLALGLVAAWVLDARWSRWPALGPLLVTLAAGPVAWVASFLVVTVLGLPRQAGSITWMGTMEEAAFFWGTLPLAFFFALTLRILQARWPVG